MVVPARAAERRLRRTKHPVRQRQRRSPNASPLNASADPMNHTPARPVSIALIDPKPLTRQSLLDMLANALPSNVALIGACSYEKLYQGKDAEELLDSVPELDLIILYIRSAGVADTWVQDQLHLIKLQRPEVPVIMISDRDDPDDVATALSYGVRGYLPTSIAAEVAIAALTLIGAGGTYIPVSALRPEAVGIASDAHEEQTGMPDELNLTSRELSVIDLLREGKPNKVIALRLNMSEATVKVHVRNILKKLRVSNRTHAATVANRLLAQRDIEANDLPVVTNDAPDQTQWPVMPKR
jgi:DNA-binding NarL/FixJ family response regulator